MTAVDNPRAPAPLPVSTDLPESFLYSLKRRMLGPPLVNSQLRHERLSRPMALGVLAPDCISSSAYGSEEMLRVLVPVAGLAAFSLLLPVTFVILAVLTIVTLSYREVVQVYTKAGGSYVVARENFGPNVAQIAAVALLIDYIVTVAVQTAAGSDAVISAIPALAPYKLEMTVGVVILLCFGNLRGIREAGRAFAFPTYFFVGITSVMIVIGYARELLGDLPVRSVHQPGVLSLGHSGSGFLYGVSIFMLLRAFANGGSSLTGLEAISNGVGAFRSPEGHNARVVLVVMSSILGFLVLGVSVLAYLTHAVPYAAGTPTVISQEGRIVFGGGFLGTTMFFVLQLATTLILYTGANTSFNGFPFLASFVAEDSFLPRWLTKRGHRLAFSNGIVTLTVVSVTLLIITNAHVDKLVAFYAIGVFTGFTMAGLGMSRHHLARRESGWRVRLAINASAAGLSASVVLIFAITKFSEGAWAVVILFPIMMWGLIRLNRQYRAEAAVLAALEPGRHERANYVRHVVFVFVDELDLAAVEALRYARSLKPSELRAVHFAIDDERTRLLHEQWARFQHLLPLETIECSDRRISRCALELVTRSGSPTTQVSVLLPRRSYRPLLGRLLHDRTADKIARVISRVPYAAATIIPYDVSAPVAAAARAAAASSGSATSGAAVRDAVGADTAGSDSAGSDSAGSDSAGSDSAGSDSAGSDSAGSDRRPAQTAPTAPQDAAVGAGSSPDAGQLTIAQLRWRQRVVVEGRVRSVAVQPLADESPVLTCELVDPSGGITLLFYGRRRVPGIDPGRRLRVCGTVGTHRGHLAIANPTYELLAEPEPGPAPDRPRIG